MKEFFLGQDAIQNYFSEFVGIIVTLLILPFFIAIYNSKLNFTKKHLAKRLLFTKLDSYLEELVPNKIKVFKLISHGKWIVSSFMTSFYLVDNYRDELESSINKKLSTLEKAKLKKKTQKIIDKFNFINSELTQFWIIYGNILNNKLKRKFYQLNSNIATVRKIKIDQFVDDDIVIFSEDYAVIISIIYEMRNLITNEYKRKFEFTKETFPQFQE